LLEFLLEVFACIGKYIVEEVFSDKTFGAIAQCFTGRGIVIMNLTAIVYNEDDIGTIFHYGFIE
jgi:hypothetical protein